MFKNSLAEAQATLRLSDESSIIVVEMERLLPDVLVLIFSHALALNIVEVKSRRLFIWETTLAIVSVCRHWREVALSSPLLWRKLCVAGLSRRNLAMFKLHLSRTKEVPLDISMIVGPPAQATRSFRNFTDEEAVLFEQIWGTIVDQQNRWESVLLFCSHIIDRTDRTWHLDNLPTLEHMFLETPLKEDSDDANPVVSLDLSRSPRLRHLSLHGDILLHPVGHTLLDRLVRLKLDHSLPDQRFPTVSDCLVILSAAPNIEQIYVVPACGTHPSGRQLAELPHLILPKLRAVEVGAHGERSAIGRLLAQLTLPVLNQLRISNDVVRKSLSDELRESHIHNYELPEFLQRSNPPLESFHLYSIVEQEELLIESLRYMPYLRKLHLVFCSTLSERFLLELSLSDNVESHLCPALELIDFQACNFKRQGHFGVQSREVIEAAVGMIMSRWTPSMRKRSLTQVELVACSLGELQDNPLIKAAIAEGLSLDCTDS